MRRMVPVLGAWPSGYGLGTPIIHPPRESKGLVHSGYTSPFTSTAGVIPGAGGEYAFGWP